MIVDSSALVAVLKREPEASRFRSILITTTPARISAATYFETSIVVDGYRDPVLSAAFDDIMEDARLLIEPVTVEQARIARQAYRDYGKGSGHRANLNFGDCFSYALAREKREPLLFKGDDFLYTDIRRA